MLESQLFWAIHALPFLINPPLICIFLLTVVLLFEVVSARFTSDTEPHVPTSVSSIVLIPAHNEAMTIQATLSTLLPALGPEDRVAVIADNCTDETANLSRVMGVDVLERDDPTRRGKGYALDFGVKTVASDPPDVIVLLDADCHLLSNALAQLKHQVMATRRPAQAIYLMEKPQNPGLKEQISAFAFKVKNLVRPLGLTRFGLPCPLTGTGMAFLSEHLLSADLASGEIVEDMKLGLDLAIAGSSPLLCEKAHVIGTLPAQSSASKSQRTRWEHGHLQILRKYVPQLFVMALVQKRVDLAWMALDLAIPPLSLLVILWVSMTIVVVGFSILSSTWISFAIATLSGVCLFLSVIMAWFRFGREELSLRSLFMFPFYLAWKIPLYFKFLVNPQNQWVRTERDHQSCESHIES